MSAFTMSSASTSAAGIRNFSAKTSSSSSASSLNTQQQRVLNLTQKFSQMNTNVLLTCSKARLQKRDVAQFSISANGSGSTKGLYNFVERVGSQQVKDDLIPFRVGMTVKVGVTVKEGAKSRVQPYEGLIIGIHRAGVASTITVRKSLQGFGVERIFPIHSPLCSFEEVRGAGKPIARRSKLYYLRDRVGKNAKLKSRFVAKKEGLSRWEVKMQALTAEKQAVAEAAAKAVAAAEAKAAAAEAAPASETESSA